MLQVINLFRDTVRAINIKDYTEAQTLAWAPDIISVDKWKEKLLDHYIVVAECNTVICGFGDIDATGYFDHLFVHKDYQRQGIAKQIVVAIEEYAKQKEIGLITVSASITAKPFFIKQGYQIVREQSVYYNGQMFTNFFMEKRF